jgi:carbon-monoxide dehydrogenase medium subunit
MYETTYHRPSSIDEAAALFSRGKESKYLAGGHTLIPVMKQRLTAPSDVIDLGKIKELIGVEASGDTLTIKAATPHFDVATSAAAQKAIPAVAYLASLIGDPAVRHRGTIGGSIAHGDPASDLPAACLALGASFTLVGPGGERTVPATEFFTGFLETALRPDEVMTEILVPKATGAGWSFQKFNRRAQDWAIVGVAAVRNGHTGIGLVNMGSTPLRAEAAETAVAAGASAAEAAAHASDGLDPPADLNASVEYRRHLAEVLVRRALEEAGLS